jgi:hypothetical protein
MASRKGRGSESKARYRELDRVGYAIADALPQPKQVAEERSIIPLAEVLYELDAVLGSENREEANVVHYSLELELLALQSKLVGFNLGEIEDL